MEPLVGRFGAKELKLASISFLLPDTCSFGETTSTHTKELRTGRGEDWSRSSSTGPSTTTVMSHGLLKGVADGMHVMQPASMIANVNVVMNIVARIMWLSRRVAAPGASCTAYSQRQRMPPNALC